MRRDYRAEIARARDELAAAQSHIDALTQQLAKAHAGGDRALPIPRRPDQPPHEEMDDVPALCDKFARHWLRW